MGKDEQFWKREVRKGEGEGERGHGEWGEEGGMWQAVVQQKNLRVRLRHELEAVS